MKIKEKPIIITLSILLMGGMVLGGFTCCDASVASNGIVSSVRMHNGAPTLFVNGRPHNGMAYAAYDPDVKVFRDFGKAGVEIYTFSATPTEGSYDLSQTTWISPDTYDYSQLDERIGLILQANPNALILPRLYLHAPAWWLSEHPESVVLMDVNGELQPYIQEGVDPKKCPSWASQRWREDSVDALGKLIAHIEQSSYAGRILGYHVASGTTEEWMMWGGNNEGWVDYSPVNIARFRTWLQGKYATAAALQSAWNDPKVTFETATIMPRRIRESNGQTALQNPSGKNDPAVIDYAFYSSDLVAETLCYFAKAVKGLTGEKKIVGTFYGYLLQLCGEPRQQNAGHLALEKVLACPDVDFITSPTSYEFRQIGGEGTSHFMAPLGSVQLHGKLWFDENDLVTSMGGFDKSGKEYLGIGAFGKTGSIEEDILQQEKELANVIVNGTGQWWFDVFSNVYADEKLMGLISALVQRASTALELDRTPADEVAMMIDEGSLPYLKTGHQLGADLLIRQLPALHRLGAPVRHYLASDLPLVSDRKMFLITTSLAPDAAQRQAVNALKKEGKVLVFLGYPGLYREGQIDESAMEDFTGIRLRLSKSPLALKVEIKGNHPWVAGLAGTSYGTERETAPVCFADDPKAKVLGTLPDGKAGLVIKEYADWTAIYSSAPLLPARLLRRIAVHAGVHLWVETEDVVWASEQLMSLSVHHAGTRKLHLPRKTHVRDLYSGKTIGTAIDSFDVDFVERSTRVFVVE